MTSRATTNNLWARIDEEPEPEPIETVDPRMVAAVTVMHNTEERLPRQLRALAALNSRPAILVAVDNGSTDSPRQLLEQARATGIIGDVLDDGRSLGFGEAVTTALSPDAPWVWLLHDDSTPQSDALDRLLQGTAGAGAAVLYPKLLQPRRRNYPETLVEIGQSIIPTGRRVAIVDNGDIDQGQEISKPVLGGSTAGMLIRGSI